MAALTSVTSTWPRPAQFHIGSLKPLPKEMGLNILQFLLFPDLVSVSLVNKSLAVISNDESLWNSLCKRDFPTQSNSTLHSKDHYRICSNVKNGRYTIATTFCSKPLLIGRGLTGHLDGWNTFRGKYLTLQDQKDGFFNTEFPRDASVVRWNGSQLGLDGHDKDEHMLTFFKFSTAKSKIIHQTLCIECIIDFSWQGKQLVILSYGKRDEDNCFDIIARIYDQNIDGIWQEKIKGEMPSCLRTTIDDVAWNGSYLAIALGDSRPPSNLKIWKSSENKLEFYTDIRRYASFLRWNGDLLVTDDRLDAGTIKVRDSRQEFKLIQTLSCPEYGTRYKEIQDLLLRGNQLFASVRVVCKDYISHYQFVTLWEQDVQGLYQNIQHISRIFIQKPVKLALSQEALFVLEEGCVKSLKFTSSYQEIFQQLAENFSELNFGQMTLPFDIFDKSYELAKERLLRMPKSQKKLFFKELNKLKGITNAEEIFSAIFCPGEISIAIRRCLVSMKTAQRLLSMETAAATLSGQ